MKDTVSECRGFNVTESGTYSYPRFRNVNIIIHSNISTQYWEGAVATIHHSGTPEAHVLLLR